MHASVSRLKINVYPVLLLRPWDPVLIANGSAYPLGCLISYGKVHKNGILKNAFDFQPLVNRHEPDWGFYLQEAEAKPAAVWLFSCYTWNCEDNLTLAKAIKERSPHSLIIVGGPHIPAYEEENREFLKQNAYIDIAVRGEGEITLAEILETIQDTSPTNLHPDFSTICGISFRKGNEIFRTADRVRNRHLDLFPSPYLTGEFDHKSFNDLPIMILETNRGCPFGCTFCDWGSATLQKFSLYDLDRVKKEIEVISKKKPQSIYLGDSNFGVFERDVEIAQTIANASDIYGYPKAFGSSFAKNASPRLAEIIKILSKKRLITIGLISIQTTDQETLAAINRTNIRNDKYEKLIEIFKNEKLKLSSELLIGLPGQTVESHKKDLQFFVDRKIMTIAYNTSVMPNAPMNEPGYRNKYKIVTDKKGYVLSTSSFSNEERLMMVQLFLAFQFFYAAGVLKYYLYFLQMEHGIRFMDFIEDLLLFSKKNPQKYPIGFKVQDTILVMRRDWSPSLEWTSEEVEFLFDHLDDYYKEITAFTKEKYGITLSESENDVLFTAQKSVMPLKGKVVPFSVELKHDLCAYVNQIKELTIVDVRPRNFKALKDFSEGQLRVSALKVKTIKSLALGKFDRWTGNGWELKSSLRF